MAADAFHFSIAGGIGSATTHRPEPNPSTETASPTAAASFRQDVINSPRLYPIAISPRADAIQFVRLSEAEYAAASFLDARLLAPAIAGAWVPWPVVRIAADGLPRRSHFIFHISHVGSTLLSRLLGQHPALFSLREPAILRDLADRQLVQSWPPAEFDERLNVCLALWSRTFTAGQTSLIKATSFVSEMAGMLMDRVAESRAIFMYVRTDNFLKGLLGGAMTDITGTASKRFLRLGRRVGALPWRLEDLSPGECVAMSWLCEMLTLQAVAAQFPARVMWIDFDRFLRMPEVHLAAALNHFGVADAEAAARDMAAGPAMTQYAKAPAYRFDGRNREQLLQQVEATHRAEIDKGLAWLNRAAVDFAVVESVLAMANE